MGKSIDEVIKSLPANRRNRIEEEAEQLVDEYNSLQEFRRSIGITQVALANEMNFTQVNISNLEKRSDMHLSTLRKYVEALGCELEIKIKLPHQKKVKISNL
jgi:predicted transcriptional regulator